MYIIHNITYVHEYIYIYIVYIQSVLRAACRVYERLMIALPSRASCTIVVLTPSPSAIGFLSPQASGGWENTCFCFSLKETQPKNTTIVCTKIQYKWYKRHVGVRFYYYTHERGSQKPI